MNTQTAFAHALLNPELPCPSGLTTWNGSDPEIRFAVYRNNVMVSLIDALADTYPVVQTLVGEEFFRAMARVFAQSSPPQSKVMAYYGRGFAEFVESFPPAASVPYLADVARLELVRVLAYHAADVVPIHPEVLQAALADPEQLMSLRLVLHPSVHVIQSTFAICSIWAAHQGAVCASSVDPDLAQSMLVYRAALDVDTVELTTGTRTFVNTLLAGQTLADAAQAASSMDPEFDLTNALTLLLRLQLITHLNTGETHHEHTH
ncbi:DUF2063 domain-containing protein [Rhodoferax sp.]|uniref:HvfC/BufC N-terminal domain-containing protein n=1 Tax=Rhodoferax sp. TaxID=50421 RepID=UPI00271B7328|nr:DNA-binding domain-containing protein [Rhodoferax sp.]MDO9143179.1 DNA-binding domain-containing protein [Rhodoferax sp.]MDP3192654.1 DNA-binding domain-containing protein [Rhodoferax sp.]MDP3338111.1 DNA-binding domain-containing protein [Rhodoferax sp.]MDP3863907.1 DNA-binding domain-containing protein [Rhodoferax sp.]